MDKKLIALAVAAAFAAPTAMAQITLYGKVHADLLITDDGEEKIWTINSRTSRLGFKGDTDLGNGMKALFKYEATYSGLDASKPGFNSSGALGDARNSYVGLSGSRGTLVVGRHDTPAKMAFYAAGNDHLGDSILDLNKAGFTEERVNNSLVYIAPAMSGFKVAAAVMPGENSEEDSLVDSYSLGVMYKSKGLKVGVGYENLADTANTSTNTEDTKMTQLGASYTLRNITVGGQYQNTKNYDNNADQTNKVLGLAVKTAFGKNALIANYVKQDVENSADRNKDSDSKHIGVALQHKFNKRANVYLAFNKQDKHDEEDANNIALGMMYSF